MAGDNTSRWTDLIGLVRNAILALNNLSQQLGRVFPAAGGTSATATAGTSGALPAQVAGYITVTLPNGTAAKVPFYNS